MHILRWEPNQFGLAPYFPLHYRTIHRIQFTLKSLALALPAWTPFATNEKKVTVCLLLLFFIFGTKCSYGFKVCARPASHNQGLLQMGDYSTAINP